MQPSAFWERFLGTRKVVPVYHDETTTYANDTVRKAWLGRGGKLNKKGMGMALMVSGYMCPCCSHLLQKNGPLPGEDIPTRVPLYSAKPGCKTGRRWCARAKTLVCLRRCMSEACGRRMPNSPRAATSPKMKPITTRKPTYPKSGPVASSTAAHRADNRVKGGSVCLPDGSCCASALLAAQPDFRAQQCRLREVTDEYNEQHGTHHTLLFLPKYHPELNPIERYWASLKAYLRKNTAWTAEGLRKLLPKALSEGVPPEQFGRYFRKSGRIASAYRLGCSFALASFAATKFKSHRGIPDDATLEKMGKELAGKLGTPYIELGPPQLLPPPPCLPPRPKPNKKRKLATNKNPNPGKKNPNPRKRPY